MTIQQPSTLDELKECQRITKCNVGFIANLPALDTAAPIFEVYGIYPRKEYAEFLEAVHTSAGKVLWRGHVGVTLSYGHVDFYPNGGIEQPGCLCKYKLPTYTLITHL